MLNFCYLLLFFLKNVVVKYQPFGKPHKYYGTNFHVYKRHVDGGHSGSRWYEIFHNFIDIIIVISSVSCILQIVNVILGNKSKDQSSILFNRFYYQLLNLDWCMTCVSNIKAIYEYLSCHVINETN